MDTYMEEPVEPEEPYIGVRDCQVDEPSYNREQSSIAHVENGIFQGRHDILLEGKDHQENAAAHAKKKCQCIPPPNTRSPAG